GHSSPVTYMGRDGRQYVALMAEGGCEFLGGGLSNSLVAFSLPDVPQKPLPQSVGKAVASAAAARQGTPAAGQLSSGAAAARRPQGVGGDDVRERLPFDRGRDEPATERKGMECHRREHGGSGRVCDRRGGSGDCGVPREDTWEVTPLRFLCVA